MMNHLTLGDMAQSFLLRRQNTQAKSDLQRLAQELSTGRTADLAKTVNGDFSVISGIEKSLKSLASHKFANTEAANYVESMQSALASVQTLAGEAAPVILAAQSSQHAQLLEAAAADAKEKLAASIATLNAQVGGRSLFAGIDTDRPALADLDTIMADLQTAIAGATTAADVETAVDTWFDTPGGGFETIAYLGSDTPLAPFEVGPGETATLHVTAEHQAIRDTLKGFALSALISEGALATDITERLELARRSGEALLTAQGTMSVLRAEVGATEAHISEASARNANETAALEMMRVGIVAADPFDTATRLQAAQGQLETLYTLTARLSRLSLVDYLR